MLEADYTNALQLLLKYPAPEPPHGPHTFVDDALFLRDHYNIPGGSSIIMKYTGKTPSPPAEPRPSTPETKFPGLSIRSRAQGARSPLASPARFISQRGGVEALFQGAAKNVIERGEKLGINQAVRDAMSEIRRNMQDLRVASTASSNNNSRTATPITGRHDLFTSGPLAASSPGGDGRTAAALERRNRQLAILLDEAIAELKAVAAACLDGDREKNLEGVETAAAKAQFVKIYLEDPSLELEPDTPPREGGGADAPQVVIEDDVAPGALGPPSVVNQETSPSLMIAEDEIMTDSEAAGGTPKGLHSPPPPSAGGGPTMEGVESSPLSPSSTKPPRTADATPSPQQIRPAPIPTRSTLARSSFSLMLEPPGEGGPLSASSLPGSGAAAAAGAGAGGGGGGGPAPHRSTKRPSNAFLFGEVVADDAGGVVAGGAGAKPFTSDDIFGLEPLRRRPSKVRDKYEDLFGGALGGA